MQVTSSCAGMVVRAAVRSRSRCEVLPSFLFFHPQRTGTRRRYQDDGISDDEIEGKRTFDLDEKVLCDRFNSELIKHMKGTGE